MDTVDEVWGHPEEIVAELHRTMRYANDLLKRAAQAGLTVDVVTLRMYGAGRELPQLSFAVRQSDA